MVQERNFGRARNFDVESRKNSATQEWVRKSIIPRLISENLPAEKVLKILHRASTWRVQNQDVASPRKTKEAVLTSLGLTDRRSDVSIELPPPSGRGRYRLTARVRARNPNNTLQVSDIWQLRGLEVTASKGFRAVYIAPHKDVNELMQKLCESYDSLTQKTSDVVDIAMGLAYFYAIGNKLIHPFMDGNHRAFNRFLEYGLAKAGASFKMPQDKTGNIPVQEGVNVWLGNFTTNFLRVNGLPLFVYSPSEKDMAIYQKLLTNSLANLINQKLTDPFFLYFYASMAGILLKWTGGNWEERISSIQREAMQRGNFTVLQKGTKPLGF